MSSHHHSASGGDGGRPPWDKRNLGLNKRGAEKRENKRKKRKRAERIQQASQSSSRGGPSSASNDSLSWIEEMCEPEMGTLPPGAEITLPPPSILDQLLEDRHLDPAVSPLPPPTSRSSSSSQALPPHTAGTGASASSSAWPLTTGAGTSSVPSSRSYPCGHCNKVFDRHQTREHHVYRKHDFLEFRHCAYCSFSTSSSSAMRSHLRERHGHRNAPASGTTTTASSSTAGGSEFESTPSCPHCNRRYASLRSLSAHVRQVHDQDGFRHCFECRFQCVDPEDYRIHRIGHQRHGECLECGTTVGLSQYIDHVKSCRRVLYQRFHSS
ncbi:Zinc finger C2H2 type domain containing protein [Gracilaria domingensis]|nr:Zinc finger C2H2 type domain containing protein [Gracilaria domingensis]